MSAFILNALLVLLLPGAIISIVTGSVTGLALIISVCAEKGRKITPRIFGFSSAAIFSAFRIQALYYQSQRSPIVDAIFFMFFLVSAILTFLMCRKSIRRYFSQCHEYIIGERERYPYCFWDIVLRGSTYIFNQMDAASKDRASQKNGTNPVNAHREPVDPDVSNKNTVTDQASFTAGKSPNTIDVAGGSHLLHSKEIDKITAKTLEVKFSELKEKINVLLYRDEGTGDKMEILEVFINYTVFETHAIFFHHPEDKFPKASTSVRKRNAANTALEVTVSTRVGKKNIPCAIPLDEPNMVSRSMELDKPLMYSRNREFHYSPNGSKKSGKWDEYISQYLVAMDGLPFISYCMDAKGMESCKILQDMFELGVFHWIHMVVKEKSRIIGVFGDDETNIAPHKKAN